MFGEKEESKNPFSGLMPQKKSSASNIVQGAKVLFFLLLFLLLSSYFILEYGSWFSRRTCLC